MTVSTRAEKFVMVPYEIYKQLYEGGGGGETTTTTSLSIRDAILNSKNIPGNTKAKLVAAADRAPTITTSPEDASEQMSIDEAQVNNSGTLEDTVASSTTGGVADAETSGPHTTGATGTTPSRAKIFQKLNEQIPYQIRKDKAQQIFDNLIKNRRVTIDPHTLSFIVDGSAINTVDAVTFLYDLQTYNKKIPKAYENLLTVANIPQNLIVNKYAKLITGPTTSTTTPAAAAATPLRRVRPLFQSTPLSRDAFESFASAQDTSIPFAAEEEEATGRRFVSGIDSSPPITQQPSYDDDTQEGNWRYTFE